MIIRRTFLQWLLGISGLGNLRFTKSPIKLKRTRIDKSKLVRLWYENEKGEKFIPDKDGYYSRIENRKSGFDYMRTQFPTQLHDNCLRIKDGKGGGSQDVFHGEKGWLADLVLAMTNSGDYELWQSILIAANSCERCMNTLAHKYGLKWGYAEFSSEWNQCGTQCDFCE